MSRKFLYKTFFVFKTFARESKRFPCKEQHLGLTKVLVLIVGHD